MFSVDAEVGIEREDGGAGMLFGETRQAGIRQGHRQVFVFANQLPERFTFPDHGKLHLQQPRAQQIEEAARAIGLSRDEEKRLRQDGLTGQKGRW